MCRTSYKKYGNHRTKYGDKTYDSKFEAGVAKDLDTRLQAGDILGFDTQYRVDIEIFNSVGRKVHEVRHKIDFRVHEKDGTFTLLEAKGMETQDYKFRRKLLESIWLPDHQDHVYEVIYQKNNLYPKGRK